MQKTPPLSLLKTWLELLERTEEKFSDAIKLTMLQNIASHVHHLKQVKETAQHLKVTLGQDLKHEGHENCLKKSL